MKPSIFVVEDDPDISRLVRHHLENDGFSVRVYPTGATVLSDAERQRPALFILDIMVPGKDGLELCRTVRQTPGLAAVPDTARVTPRELFSLMTVESLCIMIERESAPRVAP